LITGVPGVGKTTLVRKITQHLVEAGKTVRGFYSLEKREGGAGKGGRRIGFDFIPVPEGTAGPASPLARLSEPGDQQPKVGSYSVDVASIDRIASNHLRCPSASSGDVAPTYVIVDEIGKMELFSSTFKTLVTRLFDPVGASSGPRRGSGRGGRVVGGAFASGGRGARRGGTVSVGGNAETRSVSGNEALVVIATLPVIPTRGQPNPFIEGIRNRKDATLFTVTRENRDALYAEILSHLSPLSSANRAPP